MVDGGECHEEQAVGLQAGQGGNILEGRREGLLKRKSFGLLCIWIFLNLRNVRAGFFFLFSCILKETLRREGEGRGTKNRRGRRKSRTGRAKRPGQ